MSMQVINTITNFIPAPLLQVGGRIFSTSTTMATSFLVVTVAEMAIRSVVDVKKIIQINLEPKTTTLSAFESETRAKNKAFNNLQANLGGVVFYSLAASNLIPYSPFVGAGVFVIHSIAKNFFEDKEDDYFISRAIGGVTRETWKHVITPLWNHVFGPIFSRIRTVISKALTFIAELFGAIFKNAHPIWYGVGVLVLAIGCWHGATAIAGVAKGVFHTATSSIAVV